MRKTLKTLIVSVLSANLLIGTMATVVNATDSSEGTNIPATASDENPTPPVEPPVVDPPVVDPPVVDPPVVDPPVVDPPVVNPPVVDPEPTYPTYPADPYIPPVTESRTPVPVTPDETEDSEEETEVEPTIASQFEVNGNIEILSSLLVTSLEDPNFVLAWEDYQTIVTDYDLTDISAEFSEGSTLNDIVETFHGNAIPELLTTEDDKSVLIFSYGLDETAEDSTPVQIVLFGDEAGNMVGSSLLQSSTYQYEGTLLTADTIQASLNMENSQLFFEEPFVTAFYQVLSNEVTYTAFATPSDKDGSIELVVIDKEFVLNYVTTEESDTPLLDKLREFTGIYFESLGIEEPVESSSTETSEVVESSEEETAETEVSSEVEVSVESNQFIEQFAPTNYDETKLVDYETISAGYEKLNSLIKDATLTVTPEELVEMFGEPSKETVAGSSTYSHYYSIEDERIVLLDIQTDNTNNVVKTMNYDIRTPKLDEEFSINVEELFALVTDNLTMDNLYSTLGEANLVEHIFTGGHQIRHVWTSYSDPEMRNIEVYEDSATESVELYYYDQEAE